MTTQKKQKGKLVPKLRFKGFDGEWEMKPIESYIELVSGFAFKGEDISEDSSGVPLLRGINITEGRIRHSVDIDRYFVGDTKKLEKLRVKEGDLVLGMDGSKVGKNVAIVSKIDEGALLIQRVARIRAKENAALPFIYQHINSIRFHCYVDVVNTSSGIPHISSKQINEFTIGFPTLPEQQKISSFLSSVDEKLTQLKRKKELLAQYKKGVMQQLFPSGDGQVPKLRFKDENGKEFPKWEEKRLGEVTSINTGSSNRQDSGLDGEFTFFDRSQDIRTSSIFLFDGEAIIVAGEGQEFIPKYFIGKFDLHQRTYAIMNFEKTIGKYLFYFIHFNRNYFYSQAVGTTVKSLRLPMFEKMIIKIPCLPEQQKIATFLSSIDLKITAITAQISQTQSFKKGLLQQMFV